jgi:endogenous inhibitor of DNA gyrase (YacG/DUF329 family)
MLYILGLNQARWKQLFPNAEEGDEPTPGIKKMVGEAGSCAVCGEKTSWRNLVTSTWICSLRCRMKALRELRQAPGRIVEDEIRKVQKRGEKQ